MIMLIIDMVNSLKADGFSFNLIIKSVDNSEHNIGSPQQLPPVPDLPEQE